MIKNKLKPVEALFSEVFPDKSESVPAPVTLYAFHEQDGKINAVGEVLDPAGRSMGRIAIDGIPIEAWPKTKPAGRPKAHEKRLAVFLAWCLSVNRWGGKYGEADSEVAEMFGYSEAKKVRDIRIEQAQKYGIDFAKDSKDLRHTFGTGGVSDPECAVMIKKPAWHENGASVELAAEGFLWTASFLDKVAKGTIRVNVPLAGNDVKINELNERKGPVIITTIRPGRK